MKHTPSLHRLLKSEKFPTLEDTHEEEQSLKKLQLRMLRIQQGLWHQKKKLVIAFEGFDAAGKGGAIQRLTEGLDPRGVKVHPIGPPTQEELGQHYMQRFWRNLPDPGSLAVFDRSWYGRVLVEKVEKLTPKQRVHEAYEEIRRTEEMWMADGTEVIKIFLAIDKVEQFKRFEARLQDPYKQWKITPDDVRNRGKWDDYVEAVDKMFAKTHTPESPWHLIPANDKHYTRRRVLELVIQRLHGYEKWMESKAQKKEVKSLQSALKELGIKKHLK